jgi:hypothetical protein
VKLKHALIALAAVAAIVLRPVRRPRGDHERRLHRQPRRQRHRHRAADHRRVYGPEAARRDGHSDRYGDCHGHRDRQPHPDPDGLSDADRDPHAHRRADTDPHPTQPPPPPSTGFPDASNTGVPAGTVLTAYTGSCTITAPVTIDAKTFSCGTNGVDIRAAGVVITRSKISGPVSVDTDTNRTWSLTLTDSEVNSGNINGASIASGNVDLLRDNIHGGHNGLECQEHASWCSIKDSYIHDQYAPATGDTHLGGMLGLGSVMSCRAGLCMEVVHNTIVCDAPVNRDGGGCTGDINLIPHFGPLHGALIQGNYLGANIGSSFCTYGGAGVENPADHIVYRDNVFQRASEGSRSARPTGRSPASTHRLPATSGSQNVWWSGTSEPRLAGEGHLPELRPAAHPVAEMTKAPRRPESGSQGLRVCFDETEVST